jgi:hypothetical protein
MGRVGVYTFGGGGAGPVTVGLRWAVVHIQRGAAPDPYGWIELVA